MKFASVDSRKFKALSSEAKYPFQIEGKLWKTVEHYVCYGMYPSEKVKNAKTSLMARAYVLKNVKAPRERKSDYYNANKVKFNHSILRKTLLNTENTNILDEKHPYNRESLLRLRREFVKEQREDIKGKKMEVPKDMEDVHIHTKIIKMVIAFVFLVASVQRKDKISVRMVEDAFWNLADTQRRKDNFEKITEGWLNEIDSGMIAKKMPSFEKVKDEIDKKVDNEEAAYLIAAFARSYTKYLNSEEKRMVIERIHHFTEQPDDIIIRPL